MGGRGAFVGALPKKVVVSYGSRNGGTVMSKELFEYMGEHLSEPEIAQRLKEQRERFEKALWKERMAESIYETCERLGMLE